MQKMIPRVLYIFILSVVSITPFWDASAAQAARPGKGHSHNKGTNNKGTNKKGSKASRSGRKNGNDDNSKSAAAKQGAVKSFSFIDPVSGVVIKTVHAGKEKPVSINLKSAASLQIRANIKSGRAKDSGSALNLKLSNKEIALKEVQSLQAPYTFLVAPLSEKGRYKLSVSVAGKKEHSRIKFKISGLKQSASPSGGLNRTSSAADIPLLKQWEDEMLKFGELHCRSLNGAELNFDQKLLATYYDAQWIYYQISDYTGDAKWLDCASAAQEVYYQNYVVPSGGKVPGYWNFSHGLARDFLSSGDEQAKQGVISLSQSASYAPDGTPLEWTADAALSREVAYAIMSYINAELLGQPHRARTEQLVQQALGHLDQWFVSNSAEYVRPFMFALTAQALITYQEEIGGQFDILRAVERGANWIWDNAWLPEARAFRYTDREHSTGGTEPAPDLNLLIAPVYAWLWHQTGDPLHKDRADQIFAGGVSQAYLQNAKQFNQNYRWSFAYVKWRSLPPGA